MTVYKLTYFNLRGRAENSRMLFALAGVEYEDLRVEDEQWPSLKPNVPFNQLPMLEIDGEKYCQSRSIERYLANKFGFAGDNEMDKFRADIIVDAVEDMFMGAVKFMFLETDEVKKEEVKKNYIDVVLPEKLVNFEICLGKNKEGSGYFVGKKLTWADVVFFNAIEFISTQVPGDILEKHPSLKDVIKKVETEPKISDWIAKRPASHI